MLSIPLSKQDSPLLSEECWWCYLVWLQGWFSPGVMLLCRWAWDLTSGCGCFDSCWAREITDPLEQHCEIKAFTSKSNCTTMRKIHLYNTHRCNREIFGVVLTQEPTFTNLTCPGFPTLLLLPVPVLAISLKLFFCRLPPTAVERRNALDACLLKPAFESLLGWVLRRNWQGKESLCWLR